VRPSKSKDSFIERRKFNDSKKVEVKNGGQKVALKRGSTKGHDGYFFNPKDVLTANPSKYVFVI